MTSTFNKLKRFLFWWQKDPECSECSTTDDVILVCNHCIVKRRQKDINEWYANGLETGRHEAIVKGQVSFSPDTIKRLIMLCHPDKHGNSEESKVVTQWLLEQRKQRSFK